MCWLYPFSVADGACTGPGLKVPRKCEVIETLAPSKAKLRRKYTGLCWRLTEKIAPSLPDIHLRAFKGGYHIDHIVPISWGFRLGIDPHLIASPENLRLIPERANLDKGQKLSPESKEFLTLWGF